MLSPMKQRSMSTNHSSTKTRRAVSASLILGTRSLFTYCFVLFVVCAMAGCASGQGEMSPPRAQNGMIDLRSWDFARHGQVSLDCELEFSWNQLLAPGDFAAARPDDLGHITVPATWNRQVWNGIQLPGRGFGTYRLTVLVQSGTEFALKLL